MIDECLLNQKQVIKTAWMIAGTNVISAVMWPAELRISQGKLSYVVYKSQWINICFRPDYFTGQCNGKAGIVAMASVLRFIGRSDRHHGLRPLQFQSGSGYFAVKLNIRVHEER